MMLVLDVRIVTNFGGASVPLNRWLPMPLHTEEQFGGPFLCMVTFFL